MVPGVCATPSTPHHPPPPSACQPSPKAVPSLEAPFPVLTRTSTRSVLLGAPVPPQLPTSHRSSSPLRPRPVQGPPLHSPPGASSDEPLPVQAPQSSPLRLSNHRGLQHPNSSACACVCTMCLYNPNLGQALCSPSACPASRYEVPRGCRCPARS